MRGTVFVLGVAAMWALVAPAPAHACGRGGGGYGGAVVAIGAGALLLAAGDLTLTLWDGASAAQKRHPSAGYGLLETVVAAPQLALGAYGLSTSGSNAYFAVYTAWMALLTAHGIWTIATAPGSTPAPPDAVTPREAPEPVPRLQMTLGPTYVPLGQAAQPGFGVVGRF